MSRFLFYNVAASVLAVGVVQLASTISGAAPDAIAQRETWSKAPMTAGIIEVLGPYDVQAAILCSVIGAGSWLLEGSASVAKDDSII